MVVSNGMGMPIWRSLYKDDTARTFLNCSQLYKVWINRRLFSRLLLTLPQPRVVATPVVFFLFLFPEFVFHKMSLDSNLTIQNDTSDTFWHICHLV